MTTYVQTGKVRYLFRNFPLRAIHPQAQKAAEAAECAGEQGAYWEMHELLFSRQDQWSGQADAVVTFKSFAAEVGVDQAQFDACLDDGAYAQRVAEDQQEGSAFGVTGTPGFSINGTLLSGAQPFSAFRQQIDYYVAGGEAPTLQVPADSYRSMGDPDAPVVVTEFSDFQCPACSQVATQVIPELIARYVETGKVRFVYREFPLDSIHPSAPKASEAAQCAGQQGAYWEMNEKLFASQSEWAGQGVDPIPFFKAYAKDFGLDSEVFAACLDSGETATLVEGDLLAGQALGVNATPYFFIGDLPIRGGLPIDSLGRIIDYVAAGGEVPEIEPSGDDWHARGNAQAAVKMVAFVDYSSVESAEHATEVLPRLVEDYVEKGLLLYILHPYVTQVGGTGEQAAEAAECAGEQGKFWEMHDRLFAGQSTWLTAAEPEAQFSSYADSLGLDVSAFGTCLDSQWATLRVQAGAVVGTLYGVPGAPVFLFNNGQGQQGSPTFEELSTVIESILNQ